MLDRVHSDTTDLGPAVALHLVLVIRASSLQHGLVDTSTTGADSNHCSVGGGHDLLSARGQLDPGPLGVGVVGDHGGIVARRPRETAAIASLLLEVGHDRTLGHLADGHDVADRELSLLAAVDELTGVHALGGDEQLLARLVPVGITEVDDGERSTTTGIMDDVLNDSLDVTCRRM